MKKLLILIGLGIVSIALAADQWGTPNKTNGVSLTTAGATMIFTNPSPNYIRYTTIQNYGANWCVVWGGNSNSTAYGGYYLAPTNGSVSVGSDTIMENRAWWGYSIGGTTTVSGVQEPKR